MKKWITTLTVVFLIVCTGVCASNADENFGIKINGKDFVHEVPMIVIDGRSYVQVRAFGELVNLDVNWNEDERVIEVDSSKTDNKYVVVPEYEENDDGEYVPVDIDISLDISEESACSIADAVLGEMVGENFFKTNPDVKIIKNTDEFITVMRYKELTVGGCAVVCIRKTDGKIMSVEFGE